MNPNIVASVSREWKQRMLIIAGALAAMASWFLFDGLVTYPRDNVRAAIYFDLKERHGESTDAFKAAWTAAAAERNWSEKKPKAHTEGQIHTQLILGGLGWLGALAALAHMLRTLPRSTRLQGTTLLLPDGRQIDTGTIRGIGKRRWKSRSIADFVYEPEPGVPRKFILDDYKYAGCDLILAEIEKTLPQAPSSEPPQDDLDP